MINLHDQPWNMMKAMINHWIYGMSLDGHRKKKRASAMARRHRAESRSSISSHGEFFGGFHGDLMGINGIFHGIYKII